MKNYPFIFLNHGTLDPDNAGKNSECYIWFNRDVTAVERKRIVETCPPPLSGLFVWGECFAYFGSGGDTFDLDIVSCYAGKKAVQKLNRIFQEEEYNDKEEIGDCEPYINDRSQNFPEIKLRKIDFSDFDSAYGDLLDLCVPRLSQDMEAWVNKIHSIVPVSFLKGPHGADDKDFWNQWSHLHLAKALQIILSYINLRPGILSGELYTHSEESETGLHSQTYDMGVLPYSERIRYFSYIFHDVLLKLCHEEKGKILNASERDERMKLADMIYDLDGITSSFDRLSYEEHYIQVNDAIVVSALHGLTIEERHREIGKLKPYTQMAYYASYEALKAGDILQHENPVKQLQEIADMIPDNRKQAVTSLLSMIAHNLIHVTPAYSKYDIKHAKPASEIFELVCSRPDAGEKDFITGTVCCEWAGNPSKGFEIAEAGLIKFPQNKSLIQNAISVCNLTGNHTRASQLLNRYESLSDKPDENFILNKSYILIKSQNLEEAQNILTKYIEQGGKKSPKILVNLFYTWWFCKSPEKKIIEQYIREVSQWIRDDKEYQSTELLENFLGLISSKECFKETIELFEEFQGKGIDLTASCWVNYTYAACFLDHEEKKRISKRIDSSLPEWESLYGGNPLTFGNMAAIYTSLDNVAKAVDYLKLAKKYNYPNYNSLRLHKDFNSIKSRKEFQELFD